jgi:hypothetical protein
MQTRLTATVAAAALSVALGFSSAYAQSPEGAPPSVAAPSAPAAQPSSPGSSSGSMTERGSDRPQNRKVTSIANQPKPRAKIALTATSIESQRKLATGIGRMATVRLTSAKVRPRKSTQTRSKKSALISASTGPQPSVLIRARYQYPSASAFQPSFR